MKVYIAGPMKGYEKYNYPEFNYAAEYFRAGGYEVFNPAENDLKLFGSVEEVTKAFDADPNGTLRKVLGMDLAWIAAEADAIYMLAGWERSYGARAEHALAVALNLEIWYE